VLQSGGLVDLIALSLVIVPLIVIVDPPASIALFLAMGSDLDRSALQSVATRACTFAALVLLTFLVVGEGLLNHIGVELYSLRIAGGLMLGTVGMNMLKEGQKPSRKVIPVASGGEISMGDSVDFDLVPLGMPMLAGPGAITLVILMGTTFGFRTVALAILVVMAFSLSLFFLATNMKNAVGENSTRAITRVMGLLIVTTAVQYFLDGLDMWQLTL
jgi:multiple antibiotic resistance protein